MYTHHDITRLLDAAGEGDAAATAQLWEQVYADVHVMASSMLAKHRPTASLAPTLVTHEVYLRMLGPDDAAPPTWENRRHFFGSIARAMQRFLVDHARASRALKRGGDRKRVPMDIESGLKQDHLTDNLYARATLAEANQKFESLFPEDAEIVRLKIVAGLTIEQIATVLDISSARVVRSWSFAKAWLCREIESDSGGKPDESRT